MFLSAIVMMKNRRASELGYIFHCVVSVFFLSSSVIFVVLVISDLEQKHLSGNKQKCF